LPILSSVPFISRAMLARVHDPQQHRQQRQRVRAPARCRAIQSANGVAALATSAASEE
jgi:hypothetical protein